MFGSRLEVFTALPSIRTDVSSRLYFALAAVGIA